jgi:hypothetical protein
MASTATHARRGEAARTNREVSVARMWVLRAMYLVLVIGLGATIVPEILGHELTSRGVIAALLGGVWVLAFLGLKYPLQMLPLLLFEFAWKAIWMIAYGLPQWSAGQNPPTFAEDMFNIAFGVVIVPLALPWGYVWRRYVKQPTESWK